MNTEIHQEVIEDICKGECSFSSCILRQILLDSPGTFTDAFLEEMKCVERFKLEKSREEKGDIGWKRARTLWNNGGYSERFKRIYEQGMSHEAIWNSLFNGHKLPEDSSYYVG